jgi:starch phosphorylase
MVGEYMRKLYNPAEAKWRYLIAETGARAKELSAWKYNIKNAWAECDIRDVQLQVNNGELNKQLNPKQPQVEVGSEVRVKALIRLGSIATDDVSVELYHGPVDSWGNIREGSAVKMDHEESLPQDGEHWFSGLVSCKASGRRGVAVRVLPRHTDLINPYELGLILWEKMTEKSRA